jgi:hypothetical protein
MGGSTVDGYDGHAFDLAAGANLRRSSNRQCMGIAERLEQQDIVNCHRVWHKPGVSSRHLTMATDAHGNVICLWR